MGIETALIVTALASTGYSVYQGEQQKKSARRAERAQKKLIEEENAKALEERKTLIDQQREQMLPAGESLKGSITGSGGSGIVGKLKNETLG